MLAAWRHFVAGSTRDDRRLRLALIFTALWLFGAALLRLVG